MERTTLHLCRWFNLHQDGVTMNERYRMPRDWCNKVAVVKYATQLAVICTSSGMTVYKMPSRPNYNICHTVNEKRHGIKEDWVVHRTGLLA